MSDIKMVESRKEERCDYCPKIIPPKTFHILVGGKVRHHMECWEKKKRDIKRRYGIF